MPPAAREHLLTNATADRYLRTVTDGAARVAARIAGPIGRSPGSPRSTSPWRSPRSTSTGPWATRPPPWTS